MEDLKTSLLVNRQVPEYIRDEYPLFLSFVEAYYEFLENKQGTELNDLTTQSKKLKTITDVDSSIDEFEQNFLSTFSSLVPVDADVDKSFLIKNILPLYQSKGSEKSFRLLFRFLFGTEIEVVYPRNSVLRASSGKWESPKSLKVTPDVVSFYTGDGQTTEFNILDKVGSDSINVYVDEVLQTTGFLVLKDYRKLIFDTAPEDGAKIRVLYVTQLDINLALNRKITGFTSGTTALVNSIFPRILNNQVVYELYLDETTFINSFEQGELILLDVWVNDTLVDVECKTVSEVKEITVIESGANYNIGDPVISYTIGSLRKPTAIVSEIYKGNIDRIGILEGGAGFEVGSRIEADGYGYPFVDIYVNSVRTDSPNTVSKFLIYKDVISDIDPANTTINAASYGLGGLSGNVNSIISLALANTSFVNIGEIIGVEINSVDIEFNTNPEFNVEPAKLQIPATGYTTSNTTISIDSFGSIGKTTIHEGGTGYQLYDKVQFTNQIGTFGMGAAAEVTSVDEDGKITEITIVPDSINGSANGFSSNATIIGTETYFLEELIVGSRVRINGEDKTVVSISSNTNMNVSSAFSNNFTNQLVRLYNKYPIGGQNYTQDKLPNIEVVSETGTNANVSVVCIFGDGEVLESFLGNNKPGGIKTITVVDGGKSLLSVPALVLTGYGDGTAVAEANLIPSFEEYAGRWTKSDGLLSTRDMKLQGLNYYIDHSYVVRSSIEFNKYKNVLKELLHPAGSITYSELTRMDGIPTQSANIVSEITLTSV